MTERDLGTLKKKNNKFDLFPGISKVWDALTDVKNKRENFYGKTWEN